MGKTPVAPKASVKAGTTFSTVPGGRYRWTKNGDGTYTIFGVPVMAELKEGEKDAPFDVDKDWLEKAVKHALLKRGENYVAPLHVYHHDMMGMGRTESGGVVMPKEVRGVRLDGKPVWAIFADLEHIPESVFSRIAKGELLYRSVELPKWEEDPEILSLALLPDEAPFFKFELMTLGEEYQGAQLANKRFQRFEGRTNAVAGMRMNDGRKHILFRFAEDSVEDDKDKKDEEKDKEPKLGSIAGLAPDATKRMDDAPPAIPDVAPEVKPDGDSQVLSFLKKLASYLGMKDEEEKPGGEIELGDDKDEDNKAPVDQDTPKEPAGVKMSGTEVAELSGQVSGLLAREHERVKQEGIDRLTGAALSELDGYTLTDEIRSTVRRFAAVGKDDLAAFVKVFKTSATKRPPGSFSEYERLNAGGHAESEPKEVLAYSSKGPKALESARRYAKMHEQLKGRVGASLASFIEIQMEAEARTLSARN
jgi:hypothetical protein